MPFVSYVLLPDVKFTINAAPGGFMVETAKTDQENYKEVKHWIYLCFSVRVEMLDVSQATQIKATKMHCLPL